MQMLPRRVRSARGNGVTGSRDVLQGPFSLGSSSSHGAQAPNTTLAVHDTHDASQVFGRLGPRSAVGDEMPQKIVDAEAPGTARKPAFM